MTQNEIDKVIKEWEKYLCEALKESLKEVKLYKAGKIKLDTWDEFKKELDKDQKELRKVNNPNLERLTF